MPLLHRRELEPGTLWTDGRQTTCGRIAPHPIAFEDDSATIWRAPAGFVGFVSHNARVIADSVEAVKRLAGVA